MVDIYNQFKDFKSFEIVFSDKKQELQKLLCSVKSIENNRIIIIANNKKNNNIFAEIGNGLNLHIYTENGIYSANSKVLFVAKGLISTEYIISYPENSKHSQRREYFRAEIAVDFEMQIQTEDNEIITINSKAKNICAKGLSYIGDKPFLKYNNIDLKLNFKEKTVKTEALLVYSKPILVENKPKFIHAFTFTTIRPSDIDFIVKKCFLQQLNKRKNKSN